MHHGSEYMKMYETLGYTVGEMSECTQEAIHFDSKKNVSEYLFRGSHAEQKLTMYDKKCVQF